MDYDKKLTIVSEFIKSEKIHIKACISLKTTAHNYFYFSLYLVSDNNSGGFMANGGLTLPETASATHNPELSPLFFERGGRRVADLDYVMTTLGDSAYLWSSTSYAANKAYFFIILGHYGATHPSDLHDRSFTLSLRCLVSTNNR